MKANLIAAYFMLVAATSLGQVLKPIGGSSDCETAIKIDAKGNWGPTQTPHGTGIVTEFKGNPVKSLYYFDEEHNTTWYYFKAEQTGYLIFDIIPEQIDDDYDFILYRYTSKEPCPEIISKTNKPIRTNIARNDTSKGSMTGLSAYANANFVHSGPGDNYSKALQVTAGDKFILVLDNYKDRGKGHSIQFNYMQVLELTGVVRDDATYETISARIEVTDALSGEKITEVTTNSINGKYAISLPIDPAKNYVVSATAKGYLFNDTLLIGKQINSATDPTININLSKLEKDKLAVISNLHFVGNEATLLPNSFSSLQKLTTVLKQNPTLKISIEGHTNGVGEEQNEIHQPLSEARAKAVYSYLVQNGIDPERLSATGFGCSRMLYPTAKEEKLIQLNRRVEVRMIEF